MAPPDGGPRLPAMDTLNDPDDELLHVQTELAAARAKVAALQAELAFSEQRVADAASALNESERARARLEATLPVRLHRTAQRARRSLVEAVRSLGRRYLAPQTRNRLVRRYPWLRRKRAQQLAPLPTVTAGVQNKARAHDARDARDLQAQSAPALFDVIFLPLIEWQERPQRPHHLARQFAENGHHVYYVNPVDMLLSSAGRPYSLALLAPNLWDVRLSAPRRPLIYREALDPAAVREMAAALDELRRQTGIASAVCIVGFPSWAPLAFELRTRFGWTIVYDCIDDWRSVEGMYDAALVHEDSLARTCDALVVGSLRVQERWQGTNPRTLLLRNGIHAGAFALACRPNETLAQIAHPLIGYAGVVSDRLDLALLGELAARRPAWQFVLAGKTSAASASSLRSLPNVHLLDSPSPEQAPAHVYHFDACLLPVRPDRASPADVVRAYEYMCVGKPVVATPLAELHEDAGYLYTASDAAAFGAQLELALGEDSSSRAQQRRRRANANTWGQRYNALLSLIGSLYAQASLIVVAYNNVALTRQCLESIYRNTPYPRFEVIVVDNASSDATRPYLTYASTVYPNLRVFSNAQNEGFARACNRGLAAARGDYVVILNNDVVTPHGWLSRLLRHLQDQTTGLVGPVTNMAGNEARIPVSYQSLDDMEAFAAAHCAQHAGQTFDIAVSALFCTAARRSLFEQIGLLDEQFEIGLFEDDDLSRRARNAGYRVVCAEDVFVHHVGEAAFKQLPPDEYARIFAANRARYERKWQTIWQPHVGRSAT